MIKTKNEQEEKVLLAFLMSLHYDYQSEEENNQIDKVFISQYNTEIDQADAGIENGNFVCQQEVEQFFQDKKKYLYLQTRFS